MSNKKREGKLVWLSGIVPGATPGHYRVEYKILRRGPKPRHWVVVNARDELEAFMQFEKALKARGYKVQ